MISPATSTNSLDRHTASAVIIPFNPILAKRTSNSHCIFCGQTLRVQTFKGKAVCLNCLQIIPSIFSCG